MIITNMAQTGSNVYKIPLDISVCNHITRNNGFVAITDWNAMLILQTYNSYLQHGSIYVKRTNLFENRNYLNEKKNQIFFTLI